MDAFAPSDQAFLEEARGDLPLVKVASWVMAFLGAIYLLGAVAFGATYVGFGATMAAEEGMVLMVMGVFFGLFMAAFAVPMIAGAWGLRQGKMWAWIITVCTGGLFAMAACMPFGAFLLYAMLSQDVRKAFLE